MTAGLQLPLLIAQAEGSNAAVVAFVFYILGIMLLAAWSHRLLRKRSFLSEYFLGSRSLGVWAFALTFAATSASGGSFIGVPAMVYTHGWIVALWIGSYMIVPIVSMGLLAKRINQIARQTGAITVPDVLRNRFDSAAVGLLATALLLFFMAFNLIAQFKGGSVILQTLLADVPLFESASHAVADLLKDVPVLGESEDRPGYLLCLLIFAVVVVVYTTYGGFRAVVWTDVLQGLVMVAGVLIMLPLAIYAAGGLGSATREMAGMTPPRQAVLQIALAEPLDAGELPLNIPHNSWLILEAHGGRPRRLFRTAVRARIGPGEQYARVRVGKDDYSPRVPAVELTYPPHVTSQPPSDLGRPVRVEVLQTREWAYGAGRPGSYVRGPGPSPDSDAGLLPLSLAVSFFLMWTLSGSGQPGNMVRLMAFRDSHTLRRAIFLVSIYYSLIYFPLVIIFCCARVLLPGWESEADRIMPEMARFVSAAAGIPWLAGILVAAPFAAVMSTMDSFLLMISSAVVRDVYQRHLDPSASEQTIKRLTYGTTLAVGAAAMLAAVSPPQFLQDIIIFTGTGLSTSFLAPVALALYWPRFNTAGAIAGMLGGFGTHLGLYAIGYGLYGKMRALEPWNFHPFLVGLVLSLLIAVLISLLTGPPPECLVRRFFCREKSC